MKMLLATWVALGLAGAIVGQDRGARLAGTWRLTRLEQPGADGSPHRVECSGLLILTEDGHMSVQVMEDNPSSQPSGGPEQYSQGGYEASFGTFKVDERAHTFNFHVEGALVRTLVGKDLPRAFELSGKHLIVKSTRPDEHWRVVWERYGRALVGQAFPPASGR